MRHVLLFGSLALALGGCAVYEQYWTAPGGNEAAFEADSAQCDQAAFVRYPPMAMGVPGYFRTHQEFCTSTSGGTSCTLINPGYLPQVKSPADTNAAARDNAFHACMIAKGWQPLYQGAGDGFTAGSGLPEAAVTQALIDCQRDGRLKGEKFNQCVMHRARELSSPRPPA